MKPRESVRREFVRQWLRKADEDLAAARLLMTERPDLRYASAFHAQQAAEKYLKATLVWHQVEFPKTHDIDLLLNLVATADSALIAGLGGAEELTVYGVEARYPGDLPDPTLTQVREAFGLAELVRDAVLAHLPDEFGTERRES